MSNRRNSGRRRNPNIASNEFGALLEKLRLEVPGLTQPDLGRAAGVEGATISFYETGKSFPGEAVASKLSEKLKSRELMAAWYKVSEQRKQGRKQKRSQVVKKVINPKANKKSKSKPSLSQQVAALLSDDQTQNLTSDERKDLLAVIEDARNILKSRANE